MDKIWVWVIVAVPLGIFWACISLDRRGRKHRRERPPVHENLLRAPGQSSTVSIEDLQDSILGLMTSATVLVMFFCFLFLRPNPKDPRGDFITLILFGVAAAVCVIAALRKMPELRARRLGRLGEQYMAEQLQSLAQQGYRVFHDI